MTKVVDNFALVEVIGNGQYGKVFRGKHIHTGIDYAVKCIGLEKYRKVPKLDQFTKNEIEVLSKLVHPNIVRFFERLKTANNVYMIYEYCSGGTLEDLIYKDRLSYSNALRHFKGLVEGFRIIAKHNILHRDIKPSNILLHNDVIKIADFGFCKSLVVDNQMTKTMVGSPIYMSPELLRGEQYSQKADVWSLGVMLYEMIFAKCPFEEKTIPRLLNLIERSNLSFPKPIDKKVQILLQGMLAKTSFERFNWKQLFEFYDKNFDTNGMANSGPVQQISFENNVKSIPSNLQQFNKFADNNSSKNQQKSSQNNGNQNLNFNKVGNPKIKKNTQQRMDAPGIPLYLQKIISEMKDTVKMNQLKSLLQKPFASNAAEDMLVQRFKMKFTLQILNVLGMVVCLSENEVIFLTLALMKKVKHYAAILNSTLSNLRKTGQINKYFINENNLVQIINNEIQMFTQIYENFVKECFSILDETSKYLPPDNQNVSTEQLSAKRRVEVLRKQMQKPYEYDHNFFLNTLKNIGSLIFENLEARTGNNSKEKFNICLLCNGLMDCILLEEIGRLVYTKEGKKEVEPYFDILNGLNFQDIWFMSSVKLSHVLK